MISRRDAEQKEKKWRMNNVCVSTNICGGDRPHSGQIWVAPSNPDSYREQLGDKDEQDDSGFWPRNRK
jgi:hypothetical protein